ncbi:hypothetical protein Tco_1521738, partial [Tanacetum coccineum]
MEIGTIKADLSSGDGVREHAEDDVGVGVEIAAGDSRYNEEEYEAEDSAGGTVEIFIDPLATGGISEIVKFEIVQGQLESDQLVASRESYHVLPSCIHGEEQPWASRSIDDGRYSCQEASTTTITNTRSGMTPTAIEEMINRRVTEALKAYEVNSNLGPIVESEDEHESGNSDGNEGGNRNGNGNGGGNGNINGGGNGNGDGNGNGGGNGDGNHHVNGRGAMPVAREFTYEDFLKCQLLNFKGTEGVVGLI